MRIVACNWVGRYRILRILDYLYRKEHNFPWGASFLMGRSCISPIGRALRSPLRYMVARAFEMDRCDIVRLTSWILGIIWHPPPAYPISPLAAHYQIGGPRCARNRHHYPLTWPMRCIYILCGDISDADSIADANRRS